MSYLNKQNRLELSIFKNQKLILPIFLSVLTFVFYRNLFIFMIFILLEYIAGELKVWFHFDIPFDFAAMAIIYFSYFDFSVLVNVILIINLIITRLLYSGLTERHIPKILVLFFIGFLIPFLVSFNFITALVIAYLVRYVAEHILLTIMNGRIMVEYVPIQAMQLIFSYFFFVLLF